MRSFFPIRNWLIAVLYGSLCLSGAFFLLEMVIGPI